ncbi:unnamed protein product [Coffea canephora]|uniref:Uncharacterized protein n=1 Tax=Coffea canephora TaxID=49390 RepID=A0A068TLU0_COFCA|nr:unnamed protein product [Coffea canephora]
MLAGNQVQAVDYDHSYTPEASSSLAKPLKPQHNGGQVINAELNNGLKGWSSYGGAKIETREYGGTKFIVALSESGYSMHNFLHISDIGRCLIVAWLQLSNRSSNVAAVVSKHQMIPIMLVGLLLN